MGLDNHASKSVQSNKKHYLAQNAAFLSRFHKPFEIHTDASDYQLGAVISKNNKPIAFYSNKLNPAQTRYTTTEKEFLAIVEMLKEF